jgi:uncharacterized membrane protein YesL
MSLFYNPQKSGKGISKEEASGSGKTPLQQFGEIFGRKFWQLMGLNMLWLLLCLPIITVGPATAALTHVLRKFVIEQPMVSIVGEFFGAFKKHFARTVIIGIFSTMFAVAFFVNLGLFYINTFSEAPLFDGSMLLALNLVSAVVFFVLNTYIYPQIVCLDLSMPKIIKNAAILSFAGAKRNAITVAVTVVTILVMVFTLPLSLIALPLAPFAQLAFLCVFNAYPAILKYSVNPYYENTGGKNPEELDFTESAMDSRGKKAEKPNIFTDLGGKETPINRKSVKTSGKVIK